MQIQYEGGPYMGFAAQAGEEDETVEKHLFDTLLKLRLIADKKECHYSRCGRTDRGVSALGQVIGLKVRSIFLWTQMWRRVRTFTHVIAS